MMFTSELILKGNIQICQKHLKERRTISQVTVFLKRKSLRLIKNLLLVVIVIIPMSLSDIREVAVTLKSYMILTNGAILMHLLKNRNEILMKTHQDLERKQGKL